MKLNAPGVLMVPTFSNQGVAIRIGDTTGIVRALTTSDSLRALWRVVAGESMLATGQIMSRVYNSESFSLLCTHGR